MGPRHIVVITLTLQGHVTSHDYSISHIPFLIDVLLQPSVFLGRFQAIWPPNRARARTHAPNHLHRERQTHTAKRFYILSHAMCCIRQTIILEPFIYLFILFHDPLTWDAVCFVVGTNTVKRANEPKAKETELHVQAMNLFNE